MNTFETIRQAAKSIGLTEIEANRGELNFIGFETYEQADEFSEKFAQKFENEYDEMETINEGEVVLFVAKNGQRCWNNKGCMYKPLSIDMYLSDLGDNYDLGESEGEKTEILHNGEYYDTAYKKMMRYSADTTNYEIGVSFNNIK